MYKEKIENLTKVFEKDELVLEMIHEVVDLSNDYVNKVVNMENSISILKFRLEPYDYRKRIEELDRNRRLTHNSLIISVKALNRVCLSEGLEPVFDGDIEDRYGVATWAGKLVNEIFEDRK